MTQNEILKKVREIIVKNAGVHEEEIKLDSHLRDDLSLDSLDTIETTTEIEKEFNVSFPEEAVGKLTDVNSLVQLIQTQLG